MNKIIISTETTGITKNDEVLECTILDENGKSLFSKRIKPNRHSEWPDAMTFNHIAPENLTKCKDIFYYKNKLESIINNSIIIGHNTSFHIQMLRQSGLDLSNISSLDISDIYSMYIIKSFNKEQNKPFKFKLRDIINHYNFNLPQLKFSSTSKAKTILKIFNKMTKDLN